MFRKKESEDPIISISSTKYKNIQKLNINKGWNVVEESDIYTGTNKIFIIKR